LSLLSHGFKDFSRNKKNIILFSFIVLCTKGFFFLFYWVDFINFYLGGTFHIANEKGGMYVVYIGAFLVRTKKMFFKKSFKLFTEN